MLSCTVSPRLRTRWGSDGLCTHRASGSDSQRHGPEVFLQDYQFAKNALVQGQRRVLEEAHEGSWP